MKDISKVRVAPDATLVQVMMCLQENACGIALVLTPDGHLIATVTDGDLRTAILRGVSLQAPVAEVLAFQASMGVTGPITASANTATTELLQTMKQHGIRHIPLLDENGSVVELALMSELTGEIEAPTAVVMAGGRGVRLNPLTENTPKPMLPVGNKPLLEHTVHRLRDAGIRRVRISTHYKAEAFIDHFGDGERFGLDIDYLFESTPLGTAGVLHQLGEQDSPILVINGDILTDVDVRAMTAFHQDHRAEMTVGVRELELRVPYGVVEADGVDIKRLVEKPVSKVFINAGLYLLQPTVCQYIPENERFDMTQLIEQLIAENKRVVSFPIHEYWMDIGQPADYERANQEMFNRASMK